MSEGTKNDKEQPPMDLLPPLAMLEVAAVFGCGAKTYGRFNWKKGLVISRCIAAGLRHVFKYMAGQDLDVGTPERPGTGRHHLACAICEFSFALEFILEGRTDLDDRYKAPEKGIAWSMEPGEKSSNFEKGIELFKHLQQQQLKNPNCSCTNPNCVGSGAI